MKKRNVLLICLSVFIALNCTQSDQTKIDLSGEWRFATDPKDAGIGKEWFDRGLNEEIVLPGSMNSNGKGNDIDEDTKWTGGIKDSSLFKDPEYKEFRQPDNFKVPFWLQPLHHYQGAAWYQKEVNIPSTWDQKLITLFLERVHWESRLWIDDQEIGMKNSLGTPHVYDLTDHLEPGEHLITLRVDNRTKDIDPGHNSHSISDHTQSNWNGVVGDMFLEAEAMINIDHIRVFPNVKEKKITAEVVVNNASEQKVQASLHLDADGKTNPEATEKKVEINQGTQQITLDYPMGEDVKLWSEFQPNLYDLNATLKQTDGNISDAYSTTFGMRSIITEGRKIMVNGRPVYLRGTLECAIFPKTGYPPTDTAKWGEIFQTVKAHGLNHVRFHSWCPPEAAFIAADHEGIYLQAEASSWANQSTTLGGGKPIDQYIYEESERMVEEYGNHPSFVMMAYGNEPGGDHIREYLTEYVNYWKNKDGRRIYTSAAGWPMLPVNEFQSTPRPRIQGWGEELNSIINSEPPQTNYDWSKTVSRREQPIVSHEIGQWCVYPNFDEIDKYDGVLRAKNFEIFRETLKENGMIHLADSFLLASGKLQALGYKADIEAALRTKGLGGFQLLDLHDFPGQGTALVGVLDAFWDQKGYITPEEYRSFCNETVPLARMDKRLFTNMDTFRASVEVAHYGQHSIEDATPRWKITGASGEVLDQGKLSQRDIPLGSGIQLGEVTWPLHQINSARKLTFTCSVGSYTNAWDIWVYPEDKEKIKDEEDVRVVQKLNPETVQYLKDGGKVLLNLKEGSLSDQMGGNVEVGFSSIFWNTAWTGGQAPHTLGILCDPNHEALAHFPTQYHSNWQWWDAMSHCGAIKLNEFSGDIKPIVRVIDDWFTNRSLGLIFEAKVGEGKIMISGVDLQTNLGNRPAGRQLLYSLKKYMAGQQFAPQVSLSASELEKL